MLFPQRTQSMAVRFTPTAHFFRIISVQRDHQRMRERSIADRMAQHPSSHIRFDLQRAAIVYRKAEGDRA